MSSSRSVEIGRDMLVNQYAYMLSAILTVILVTLAACSGTGEARVGADEQRGAYAELVFTWEWDGGDNDDDDDGGGEDETQSYARSSQSAFMGLLSDEDAYLQLSTDNAELVNASGPLSVTFLDEYGNILAENTFEYEVNYQDRAYAKNPEQIEAWAAPYLDSAGDVKVRFDDFELNETETNSLVQFIAQAYHDGVNVGGGSASYYYQGSGGGVRPPTDPK